LLISLRREAPLAEELAQSVSSPSGIDLLEYMYKLVVICACHLFRLFVLQFGCYLIFLLILAKWLV